MAKTKPKLDRNEKREEILRVARRLFLSGGYDVISMSRIADEAGVAPNTIYWYFADKDALLNAVLNAVVTDLMREFGARKKWSADGQLIWLVEQLERGQNLLATVHARLDKSEALSAWHENMHRVGEAMVRVGLSGHGMAAADVAPAARVYMLVMEGLLAHPASEQERQAIAKWFLSALGKVIHASARARE